jgi:hypothetical protein
MVRLPVQALIAIRLFLQPNIKKAPQSSKGSEALMRAVAFKRALARGYLPAGHRFLHR